jgi:hypothetical protein
LHLICCWVASFEEVWEREVNDVVNSIEFLNQNCCCRWCCWIISLRPEMLLTNLYFDWSSYSYGPIQSIQQSLLFFFENLFDCFTKLCLECFIICLSLWKRWTVSHKIQSDDTITHHTKSMIKVVLYWWYMHQWRSVKRSHYCTVMKQVKISHFTFSDNSHLKLWPFIHSNEKHAILCR